MRVICDLCHEYVNEDEVVSGLSVCCDAPVSRAQGEEPVYH